MSIKNSLQLMAGLALLAALAGCGDTTRQSRLGPPPQGQAPKELPQIAALAGIDLVPATATQMDVVTIARSMSFGSRWNSFALGAGESAFDQEQRMLNLMSQGGNFFPSEYIAPEERPVEDEIKRVEVPLWRLSGVVIGESVSALLDKGPGQTVPIHPGMIIDGWMCVSIDSEKAVFRRMDDAEPNTMEVRLSLPMGGGVGSSGGSGGGTTGGNPGTGREGGPPRTGTGTGK
jgi:hypothetical protein